LSPLLWNFYFREVAEAAEKCSCKPSLFGFADDVAIVVHGTSQQDVFTKLIPVYQHVRVWASLYRVQFSDSKVQCMDIAPTRYKRPHFDNLEGKVVSVQCVSDYKYLGAIIDNKLSFQPWCEKIAQEVDRRLVFIQRLVKTGKLSRLLTERLYQGYVRGFVNYGCCVWSLGSARFVDRITCADRRGLRLCCGALLHTRTEALESQSSLEPLQLHVKRLV
jgi:hypothetical protein